MLFWCRGSEPRALLALLSDFWCEPRASLSCLSPPHTSDELWPVALSKLLQEAVVDALCLLRGHRQVEVGLVPLEDALEGELADTQHLVLLIHDTLGPVFPTLVLKHTQV